MDIGDNGEEDRERLVARLIDKLDPAGLAGLALADMSESPSFSLLHGDGDATINRIYGSDERMVYAVLYRLGDKHFSGFAAMVRYDDRWLIESLFNPFSGGIEPAAATTRDEYEKLREEMQKKE
jgi:hypothetical protein